MSKNGLTMVLTGVLAGKYPVGVSALALSLALAACSPPATQDNPQAAASLGALPLDDAALSSESAALPPLPAVLPLVTGPAAPVRYAPAAAALPRARTLGYTSASGNDRYAWIDRADRISDTIGDAPPDYAFDYGDGVEPYGWETAGGYRTYAEPIDGGYRTYYYDPGADEPYLVRDPSYSYGYSGGRIVTVYDRGGRVLEGDYAARQADAGSRYYERARALRAAANARQRRGVVAAQWADRRATINRQRAQWDRARNDDAQWRAYRNDHAAEDQRLAAERDARARAARQFTSWQDQGFHGDAPVMYVPAPGGRRDGGRFTPQQQAQLARAQQQQQMVQQQRAQQAAQQQMVQQQRAQQAAQQQMVQQRAAQQQLQDQQRAAQQARQLADQRAVALAGQRAQIARAEAARAEVARVQAARAKAVQAQALDQAARRRQNVIAQQRQLQQTRAIQLRDAQKRAAVQQADQARLVQQRAVEARAQQQSAAAQADKARVAQRQQAVVQQQRAVQQHIADLRQRQAEQAKQVAEAKRVAAQAQQVRKAAQQSAIEQRQQLQANAKRNAEIARQKNAKPAATLPQVLRPVNP